jgi:hypothetical protein
MVFWAAFTGKRKREKNATIKLTAKCFMDDGLIPCLCKYFAASSLSETLNKSIRYQEKRDLICSK